MQRSLFFALDAMEGSFVLREMMGGQLDSSDWPVAVSAPPPVADAFRRLNSNSTVSSPADDADSSSTTNKQSTLRMVSSDEEEPRPGKIFKEVTRQGNMLLMTSKPRMTMDRTKQKTE